MRRGEKSELNLIGITGAFGSGKSTASDFFTHKGFTKITLSLFLEEEARKRGVSKITRRILQNIGNEWRKKYGKGVLAKKAIDFIKTNRREKVVIDGIRNIGELDVFAREDHFLLLGIIADRKTRFERLQKMGRREKLSLDLFNKLDRRDLGVGESETGLQVAICIGLADHYIENNTTIGYFTQKLTFFFESYKKNKL